MAALSSKWKKNWTQKSKADLCDSAYRSRWGSPTGFFFVCGAPSAPAHPQLTGLVIEWLRVQRLVTGRPLWTSVRHASRPLNMGLREVLLGGRNANTTLKHSEPQPPSPYQVIAGCKVRIRLPSSWTGSESQSTKRRAQKSRTRWGAAPYRRCTRKIRESRAQRLELFRQGLRHPHC